MSHEVDAIKMKHFSDFEANFCSGETHIFHFLFQIQMKNSFEILKFPMGI